MNGCLLLFLLYELDILLYSGIKMFILSLFKLQLAFKVV